MIHFFQNFPEIKDFPKSKFSKKYYRYHQVLKKNIPYTPKTAFSRPLPPPSLPPPAGINIFSAGGGRSGGGVV